MDLHRDAPNAQLSICVGSTGPLLSLIDKEVEILHAANPNRHPKPLLSVLRFASPSLLPWTDLTRTLLLKSSLIPSFSSSSSSSSVDYSCYHNCGPAVLFCANELNPSGAVQEACHIRAPRQLGSSDQHRLHSRDDKKETVGIHQHNDLHHRSQVHQVIASWWKSGSLMCVAEREKKSHQKKNKKMMMMMKEKGKDKDKGTALRVLARLCREEYRLQKEKSMAISSDDGEEDDDDEMKPMLG